MTGEEAIYVLKQEQAYLGGGPSPNIHEYEEALDMAISALREQEKLESNLKVLESSGWISVEEKLPSKAEEDNGIVGIVSGYNGRITFTDALLFLRYDFEYDAWWSEDYDIEGCKVTYWMPLPSTEGLE